MWAALPWSLKFACFLDITSILPGSEPALTGGCGRFAVEKWANLGYAGLSICLTTPNPVNGALHYRTLDKSAPIAHCLSFRKRNLDIQNIVCVFT